MNIAIGLLIIAGVSALFAAAGILVGVALMAWPPFRQGFDEAAAKRRSRGGERPPFRTLADLGDRQKVMRALDDARERHPEPPREVRLKVPETVRRFD